MTSLGERALDERGIPYIAHEYDYRKKGADVAAEAIEVPIEATVKSLVVECDRGEFVFLLMTGDHQASLKDLARHLKIKTAQLARDRDAERLTGYQVGGMSPLGSRTELPVYLDLQALDHNPIYINGGRRGLILEMKVEDLMEATEAELVDVAR